MGFLSIFKRKENLRNSLSRLLDIEKDEINTERMTADIVKQLEFIVKEAEKNKIFLSEEKKRQLVSAIKRINQEVTLAKYHIKQLALDVGALSRRGR